MKSLRERAVVAGQVAMQEVVADFGDDASVYLRDAVDSHLIDVDPDRMDLMELEDQLDDGRLSPDVVAVLSDGGRLCIDLEAGTVEVRDE
jgi:hypothetical protein